MAEELHVQRVQDMKEHSVLRENQELNVVMKLGRVVCFFLILWLKKFMYCFVSD